MFASLIAFIIDYSLSQGTNVPFFKAKLKTD